KTDPLSPQLLMQVGMMFRGKNADSTAWYLQQALNSTPTWTYPRHLLAHTYLFQGRRAEAIAEFEQAARIGGASDSAQLAYGYAVTDRRAEARAIVRSLVASGERRYLSPANMALAYSGLGDDTSVWHWVEAAMNAHDPMSVMIYFLPAFDRVREDP